MAEMVNCPAWIKVTKADVPAGTRYWRLVKVEYQNDQQSGGNHHIYSREPHDPNVKMEVSNGQERWQVALDKPTNEAAGNFAMWAHNHYSARIAGLPSDQIEGMHMPSNHHVNYVLWWEEAVKAGGTPPTETGGEATTAPALDSALLAQGEAAQLIRFNPDAAIQKVIFREGFVPNSAEFSVTHEGKSYVAQRAERLSDGAVRVFYVQAGDWGNVKWVERS